MAAAEATLQTFWQDCNYNWSRPGALVIRICLTTLAKAKPHIYWTPASQIFKVSIPSSVQHNSLLSWGHL